MQGSSKWKDLASSSIKRFPEADITLRDWQSSEVKAIIESLPEKKKKKKKQMQPQEQPDYKKGQMKKLAELLDKNWDNFYSQKLEALVYDAKNDQFLEISVASSFSKYLVQQPWLPSTLQSSSEKVLCKGSELFSRQSVEVKNLLHTHAPYLDASLQSIKFLEHLKVRSSISRLQLLDYLVMWSKGDSKEENTFFTSIDHMIKVYSHLLENTSYEELIAIKERFTEESSSLIFVPDRFDKMIPSSDDVEGHFVSVHDVCWMDPTTVLYNKQKFNWSLPEGLPRILSLHYEIKPQMKDVFAMVGINKEPLVKALLVLLEYNSSLGARPEIENIRDFTSVVLHLARQCEEGIIDSRYLHSNLRGMKVFPSHHHVWVTAKDCLLDNDDPRLATTFGKVDKVHFLQWPVTGRRENMQTQEDKEAFLKLCNIPKLSTKVCTRIDHGKALMNMDELKAKVALWIPLIQRFLYNHYLEQYNRLVLNGITEKLKRLQVHCAEELKCLYYIEHDKEHNKDKERFVSPEPTPKNSALEYDISGIPIIYVSERKKDKPPTYLLSPLCDFFMDSLEDLDKKSFREFLSQLLSDLPVDKQEVDEFSREYQLPELGDGEAEWVIPIEVKNIAIEEESLSESDESEEVQEEGMVMEDHEGNKAVTSWPPRAAVEPSSSHKKSGTEARNVKVERSSEDVVGEKEVKEMREKHLVSVGGVGSEDTESTSFKEQSQEQHSQQGQFFVVVVVVVFVCVCFVCLFLKKSC